MREARRLDVRLTLAPPAGALAVFGAVMSASVVATPFSATGPVQRGYILGSGITAVFGMVAAFVVLLSGTAPLMMGESAEQWTAQELRPLSQHGWRLVNHFGLGRGDQDHVLVGRVAPVLVLWGAAPDKIADSPGRRHRSGVLVIPGKQLRTGRCGAGMTA